MLIELYFHEFQLLLAPSRWVYLHTMVQMSHEHFPWAQDPGSKICGEASWGLKRIAGSGRLKCCFLFLRKIFGRKQKRKNEHRFFSALLTCGNVFWKYPTPWDPRWGQTLVLKPFVRWRQCLWGQGLLRTGSPNNKVTLCIPFTSLAIGFVHIFDWALDGSLLTPED